MEGARRNFAAQKDQEQVTRISVSGTDFVVNTVQEV